MIELFSSLISLLNFFKDNIISFLLSLLCGILAHTLIPRKGWLLTSLGDWLGVVVTIIVLIVLLSVSKMCISIKRNIDDNEYEKKHAARERYEANCNLEDFRKTIDGYSNTEKKWLKELLQSKNKSIVVEDPKFIRRFSLRESDNLIIIDEFCDENVKKIRIKLKEYFYQQLKFTYEYDGCIGNTEGERI